MRERLLDAAEDCYRRFGIGKTVVEDVGKAASLSRATVYRYFENRDELLLGVVAREAYRLAAEAQQYLRRFDNVGSWIVEGLLFCLREIPGRPTLAILFGVENVGAASRLVLRSAELSEIGVRRVSVGSALSRAAFGAFLRAAREMASGGTFSFAEEAVSYRELSDLFPDR